MKNTVGSRNCLYPFHSIAIVALVALLGVSMLAGCGESKSTAATLTAITVTPSTASFAIGTITQFKASGAYSDGSYRDLTTSVVWSSSDGGVASVSNAEGSKGAATAVALGTATIKATSGKVSGSTEFTSAALVSIAVTPVNFTSIVGTTRQFSATGTLSNGATQDLTSQVAWESTDSSVAIISATGITDAAAAGQTTIRATFTGISGSTVLTTATVASIAVAPANSAVNVGAARQFSATATLSNGATQDVTSLATWISSNTLIAAINSGGLASSLSTGSATISAGLSGVFGTATLTVQGPVTIAVTPANPSLVTGSTQQFTAVGTFADGSVQELTTLASWSSSNVAVAAISDAPGSRGLATVSAAGSAIITATLGASGTTTITARALSAISITPASPAISVGSTIQLVATGTFSDSSTQDLTNSVKWETSNPTIATISDAAGTKGVVTAVSPGSATVKATIGGVSISATLTVSQLRRAYVVNKVDNTLSVIDTATNLVVTTIAVGSGPQGVALNSSTGRAYVTNSNSNSLSVIDTSSNTVVATVSVGAGPGGIALNPSTGRAYVANSNNGTLSVIDTGSNLLTATVAVGSGPRSVALNPATSRAYVVNSGSNNISVIDTTINSVVAIIAVGAGPQGVALHPAASRAYVANSGSNTLSVIDTVSNSVIATLPVANGPKGIAVNPTLNRLYVTSSSGNSTLTVIDTTDNTTIAAIAVGSSPQGVVLSPAINRAYVANSGSNTLTVIDTGSNSAVATIGVGVGPSDVAVNP